MSVFYPGVHIYDRLGLTGQVECNNIHHLRSGAEVKVISKWEIIFNVHNYWLASATDGLFTPANLQLARVELGAKAGA